MQLSNAEVESLIRGGVDALRQGRPAEARARFERLTGSGRANGQILLLLATACRAQEDLVGEEAALDQLLASEPKVVRGHIMKGDCRAKAGDDRSALAFYESGLLLAAGQQVPDDLAAELRRVQAWVDRLKSDIEQRREAALAASGLPPEARSWSALFLCENGSVREATVALCPRASDAVWRAPLVVGRNSPTVMFSSLRGHDRAPYRHAQYAPALPSSADLSAEIAAFATTRSSTRRRTTALRTGRS